MRINNRRYYIAIETTINKPYKLYFFIARTNRDFRKLINLCYQCSESYITYDCTLQWYNKPQKDENISISTRTRKTTTPSTRTRKTTTTPSTRTRKTTTTPRTPPRTTTTTPRTPPRTTSTPPRTPPRTPQTQRLLI